MNYEEAAIAMRIHQRHQARRAVWSYLQDEVTGSAPMGVAESEAGPQLVINSQTAHRLIRQGISSRAIEPLSDFLGLGKGVVAEYLDLDRSTAHRRAAKDQPLPMHAAEGLLRLLELDQMATDTFETEAEAAQWLSTRHPMLDDETPLEAARSSYGAERVKDILIAIKWGGVV